MIKIIVVGAQGVGKTSLCARIQNFDEFNPHYVPTIAINIIHLELNGIRIQLYDCSGAPQYHAITVPFITDSQMCLLCVDLSTVILREHIEAHIKTIRRYSKSALIVLIGAKLDILQEHPEDNFREENLKCFHSILSDEKILAHRILTSAKNGLGITEICNTISPPKVDKKLSTSNQAFKEEEPFIEECKENVDEQANRFPFKFETMPTTDKYPDDTEAVSANLFLRIVTSRLTKSIAALLVLGGLISLGIGIACLCPISAPYMLSQLGLTVSTAPILMGVGAGSILVGSTLGIFNTYLRKYLPEDNPLHPHFPK